MEESEESVQTKYRVNIIYTEGGGKTRVKTEVESWSLPRTDRQINLHKMGHFCGRRWPLSSSLLHHVMLTFYLPGVWPASSSTTEWRGETTRLSSLNYSLISRTVNHRKLTFPNRTDLEITCNCSIQLYYLLILIGGSGQSVWMYVRYQDKK